jgi:hypothetical protein
MKKAESDMDIIRDLLEKSIKKIRPEYYISNNRNRPRYRERIFCYELYHQLRSCPLGLVTHAEPDKRGHWAIQSKYNPDIIMHIPGTMKHNNCIIEVKTSDKKEGIFADFSKIHTFIQKYNYQIGVFILIGYEANVLEEIIRKNITELNNILETSSHSKILMVSIKEHGQALKIQTLQELLGQV